MYRLALDLGIGSIGWCLYDLNDNREITGIADIGSRIFARGANGASRSVKSNKMFPLGVPLNMQRRTKRAMRRMREREARRKSKVMNRMKKYGIFPTCPEKAAEIEGMDPYQLRAFGIAQQLSLHEIGRAIFHLNQRRGFKSNRKTDGGDDEENGLIKKGISSLDMAMADMGAKTYGEFLYRRQKAGDNHGSTPGVRLRKNTRLDEKNKPEAFYDFYPSRQHYEDEFNAIWAFQKTFYPDVLTDEAYKDIFEAVFHQRPLKKPQVGNCLFNNSEERLAKSSPIAQRFIMLQTINMLRVSEEGAPMRPLTKKERDDIYAFTKQVKVAKNANANAITFDKIRRAFKGLENCVFNLETENRSDIGCDGVRAAMGQPNRFGFDWDKCTLEDQCEVIKRLDMVETEEQAQAFSAWLQEDFDLHPENAEAVLKLAGSSALPAGHLKLGETAARRVGDELEKDVIVYSEAVERCGWHHSDFRTGEVLDTLPYYGYILDREVVSPYDADKFDPEKNPERHYGKIANPTVHVALNQLRRVVNMIITVYGKPEEIVVEVAREMKASAKSKAAHNKRIKDGKKENDVIRDLLEELGMPANRNTREILRFWREQGGSKDNAICPYSGERITKDMLRNSEVEIDHILPYSMTLDNSADNKVLCLRRTNREKGQKSPYQAFAGTPAWGAIKKGLKRLPKSKAAKFRKDALESYLGDRLFSDHMLTDTQYIAKISKKYLESLYTEGGHIWAVPGMLTAKLRRAWDLDEILMPAEAREELRAYKEDLANAQPGNRVFMPEGVREAMKNRDDLRHHAIDAAVIGATDRSTLMHAQKFSGRNEIHKFDVPPPWEGFKQELEEKIANIIVSHKADRGSAGENRHVNTSGALHEETLYGVIDDTYLVSRTDFLSLTRGNLMKGKLRDTHLADCLYDHLMDYGDSEEEFQQALRDFQEKPGPYKGISRVRVLTTLDIDKRVELVNKEGKRAAYKSGSNAFCELWKLPDGKPVMTNVKTFDAHQNGDKNARRPHPAAAFKGAFYIGDMVKYHDGEKNVIGYIQCANSGKLMVTPNNQGTGDERAFTDGNGMEKYKVLSANQIVANQMRQVSVDELGRVRDNGFRW